MARKRTTKKYGVRFYTDIRVRRGGVPTGERVRRLIPKVKGQREADEAERKIAASIMYGDPLPDEMPTFKEFVEGVYFPHTKETLSRPDNVEYSVRAFLSFFEGRKVDALSPFDVERFKVSRIQHEKKGGGRRSAGAVNGELANLSSICRLAVTRGHLKSNPCAEVEYLTLPPHRVRFLTAEEESDILAQLDGYMVSVVRVAVGTGLRLNELLDLRREAVDFPAARLYVENPKWKADRRRSEGIPLSAPVLAELERLCSDGRRGHLFLCQRGTRPVDRTVQVAFRRACERAKVRRVRFHDLRHTFGSRLGQAGVSPFVIARLMGHADLKRTMIYVHLTERDEREAVECVFGQHAARGAQEQPKVGIRKSLRATG